MQVLTAPSGFTDITSTANDGYRIILRNGSLDFTYGGHVNHLFSDISESTVFNGLGGMLHVLPITLMLRVI